MGGGVQRVGAIQQLTAAASLPAPSCAAHTAAGRAPVGLNSSSREPTISGALSIASAMT